MMMDGKEPAALVEWGDVDPHIEELLEWVHTRTYNAWHHSERIRNLSGEEFAALPEVRMDAHAYLDADEHGVLRAIERSIREVEAGEHPDVENTHELDVAWAELLADALVEGR